MSSGAHAPRRHFNSRPSARGDRSRLSSVGELKNFNSRPSARGDARPGTADDTRTLFQFTPLREGRLAGKTLSESHKNFNSRPSARGDQQPARASQRPADFNSRPSARGDASRRQSRQRPPDFNSRPSARGDLHGKRCRKATKISIHAPPRGATRQMGTFTTTSAFQFTPLREGRRQKICNFCKSFVQPLQISMA